MNYIDRVIEAYNTIDREELDKVVLDLHTSKGVLIAGNGGSYCNATHFSQDLLKTCDIPALSLLDNVSLLTAVSNDLEYSKSISYPIWSYMTLGFDTLFLISGSGNSDNVVNAAMQFRDVFRVISLTGFDGGLLKDFSDRNIHVECDDMRVCESVHSIILHEIIQEVLYADF